MADQKTFPVFAYVEEHVQLEDLREYLAKNGADVPASGSDDVAENLIEICGHLHVLSKMGEQATDFIISSVTSLIVTVAVDKCLAVVTAFCKAITPAHFKGLGPQSSAGYAVRALSNLYRGFAAHPKIQEVLYAALVDMCNEARLISTLDCSVEDLEEYFAKWNTNTDVKRHILRQVHIALLTDGRADQAAKVMVMLLGSYTNDDAASAKDDATECVRTAVVDPKSFSFDHLQRLSAVKALQKSDPLMYSALELFINGTLKEYKEFVKSHPKFVTEKLKVDEAILVKKIRLLTLMTIAENNKVINLDELAQQLDLPADEVLEEFIIEAIQVNAISGKLNEMSRQLVVSSFQHRQFGREQWVALQKRLQNLICNLKQAHTNVHHINESIEETVAN